MKMQVLFTVMENNIKNKIKSILGMPVQPVVESTEEQTPVVVATSEEQTVEILTNQEEPTSVAEPNLVEQFSSQLSDLQSRVTSLESELTATKSENIQLKSQQEQIMAVVDAIADQPSASAPVQTESKFSKQVNQAPNEKRLKNMLNILTSK